MRGAGAAEAEVRILAPALDLMALVHQRGVRRGVASSRPSRRPSAITTEPKALVAMLSPARAISSSAATAARSAATASGACAMGVSDVVTARQAP